MRAVLVLPILSLVPLLSLGAGCQRSSAIAVGDVTVTLDPNIATVAHATWTTETPTTGYVVFGDSDAYGMQTPLETAESTEHTATIYGLQPDSELHFAAAAEADGEVSLGADATLTTGSLPDDLPEVTENVPWDNAQAGPFLITSIISPDASYTYVVVLDTDGAVVWYHRVETEVACVRPLMDGSGVYFIKFELQDADASALEVVRWDGTADVIAVPQIHHDAEQLDDGSYAVARTTYQEIDGVLVGGDQLIRVQDDASVSVLWDAFENLPVTRNDGWDYIGSAGFADWTHVNGVVYDADSDTFALSLWNAHEIVAIDASTGAQRWVLGGTDGEFSLSASDDFGPQHAPELFAGGVRLFDNNTVSGGSRLVEYTLDTSAMTAAVAWSHTPPTNQFTPVLGDVHRFEDGSALSSWGYTGRIQTLDASGQINGEIAVPYGTTIGQVTVLSSFYAE